MKRKELENIVHELGLEFDVDNNIGTTIMQVWKPFTSSGFKIDSKYYSAATLGKNEVEFLNSDFRKLLKVLDENNIRIIQKSNIENGVISAWVLHLKEEPLTNAERNSDFEINTSSVDGALVYSRVMPAETGYQYSHFKTTTLYSNDKLKKHELELMLKNIDEILTALDDKRELLIDFSIRNNTDEPIKYLVEKGIMAPRIVIEALFKHDDIYYDNQREFSTILKYLTTLKADNINILNNNKKGTLPDLILELGYLYKNVLKNWEFEKDTGQKILTMMVQDEHTKQFRQFIEAKNPDLYYFRDWYDLQEQALKIMCNDDTKLLKKLITDGWLHLEGAHPNFIMDFLIENFNQFRTDGYLIIMHEFMDRHTPQHKTLMQLLFEKFDAEMDDDSILTREIMSAFIKDMKITATDDFMINDAAIMLYLGKDHPLRQKLLSDEKFIAYLVEINKLEYMPKEVTDIFLF